MVNVKSDPDIYVKVVQGDVSFPDGGEGILLPLGSMLSPNSNGHVLINNKSKNKWLQYTTYDEKPTGRTPKATGKVNPGKNVSIHSVPATENLGAYPIFIGSFKWSDTDPNPSDPGGETPSGREWDDFVKWVEKNGPWIALALLALGITGAFIYFRYFHKDRPVQGPVVAPVAPVAPAPVVVVKT